MNVRPSRIDIDLAAVRHNVGAMIDAVGPSAMCAVVKADGYGHGAVAVARAAIDAGATWLAVALVEEGTELRAAGLDVPILMLSEPGPQAMAAMIQHRITPTLYTPEGVASAAELNARMGSGPLDVQLKVNTGMNRVGAMPLEAFELAQRIVMNPALRLGGVWTHLASAEVERDPSTPRQLDRFDEFLAMLRERGIDPGIVHAANSAAALRHPRARFDLVRCGLTVMGLAPSPQCAEAVDLHPVMRVSSEIGYVRRVATGEAISYGGRRVLDSPRWIATVPLGYADGVRRSLGSSGGEVLVRGARFAIAGTVTMDQFMVDLGDATDRAGEAPAQVGDEVVLLGSQSGPLGSDRISAEEWADRLDTISYEVVCGFGPRLPRVVSASA